MRRTLYTLIIGAILGAIGSQVHVQIDYRPGDSVTVSVQPQPGSRIPQYDFEWSE